MNNKKLLFSLSFCILAGLFTPRLVWAVDESSTQITSESFLVRMQERIEYFFAFGAEKKVAVLEKQAEKRLSSAQEQAEEGNDDAVQKSVQNYLQVKEKQDDLLDQVDDEGALGAVQERTINQQQTMEEIKNNVSEEVKNEIVQVQEQVVNQVAERVVDVNGTEGLTEFFQKVEHVWAPGTGPGGGEAGVVIEGGTMQFAPGTSAGGNSGADIKNVEVKTGGGPNN